MIRYSRRPSARPYKRDPGWREIRRGSAVRRRSGSGWGSAWCRAPPARRLSCGRRPGRARRPAPVRPTLPADLPEPARLHQHRVVPVEVRGGEERRCLILDQGLLVGFGLDPEDDHVGKPFSSRGVHGVRPRGTEEDEGLPTHLVHGIAARPVDDGHVREPQREFVHVLYPCRPISGHAGQRRSRSRGRAGRRTTG